MSDQSACPADTIARLLLTAATPDGMDRIGEILGPALGAADTVALSGPLGAGKSHLARALIRARLGDPQAEVPSPSYTLVNVYTAGGTGIWHADLYRIADTGELAEIGLDDAIAANLVLIEWPERWPGLPGRRLDIAIAPQTSGARTLHIAARGPGWGAVLAALEGAR